MLQKQGSSLETGTRIAGFLDRNGVLVGTFNQSQARKDFDAVIQRLKDFASGQMAGEVMSKGETTRQRTLRLVLRVTHMRPIAAIAAAKLHDVPNFSGLKMPSSHLRGMGAAAAADAMATAAEPYAAIFVANGRPADFIAQMRAAAEGMRESLGLRATSRGVRKQGTAGLAAAMKTLRKAIRVIDADLTPKLVGHSELEAEWKALKRVHKKPGPVIGSIPPTPPVTLSAAAPASGPQAQEAVVA